MVDKASTQDGMVFHLPVDAKDMGGKEGAARIVDYVTRFMGDRGVTVEGIWQIHGNNGDSMATSQQRIEWNIPDGDHLSFKEKADGNSREITSKAVKKFGQALADLSQVVMLMSDKQTGKWGGL